MANFHGHSGHITSVSFSENGCVVWLLLTEKQSLSLSPTLSSYYLATAGEDSQVKLWDLRKLKNFKTINVGSGDVQSLTFDMSGTYLAMAGTTIQ